jgi:hypothetical protein
MHLTQASELIGGFGDACKQYVVAEHDGHGHLFIYLSRVADLPLMLPVVISDAIHNMRAALDYIVFELALLDVGQPQDGTQFLIEDVKSDPADARRGFDGRKGRYLKGLNARHIDMIEALQPYKPGMDWSKTLRDISNPDKHRNLTVLQPVPRLIRRYVVTFDSKVDLNANPIRFTADQVQVDASNAIYISPADVSKPALMPTLRNLQLEIARVLEFFKPEFPI